MANATSPSDAQAPSDTAEVAATYFRSWQAGDWDTLRTILADDVSFEGPMASLTGADECVAGLQKMAGIMTDVAIQHVFVDGPDVVTWFDLHTSVAPPVPTANWSHVESGKVTAIRVAFDARPLV